MKVDLGRFKRNNRLCQQCGEHPALHRSPTTGRVIFDRKHRLCVRCFRSANQSAKQKALDKEAFAN